MITTLQSAISRAREAADLEAADWQAHMEARRIENNAHAEQATPWLATLVKASPGHYAMWLKGAAERGVEITHVYDYPLPRFFHLATRDIAITPLHGSASVSIIVPAGIQVSFKDLGHNHVYHMDGFTHTGMVPLYSNIA